MGEDKKEEKKEVKNTQEVKKEEVKKSDINKEVTKNETVKPTNNDKKFETKKQDKKKVDIKTNKKKSNNYIILTVFLILVLVVLAILAYMFMTFNSPRKSVEGMLNALKIGDYDKVNEYADYNNLMSSSEMLDTESLDQEAQKLLFNKLSWNILNVSEENDKATVQIEITNKDFKTIIGNYMQKALKAAFSGQQINEEQIQNYLLEELKNENVQTDTSTQEIKLNKQDGKWVVSQDENDLINILLPGLNEAINSLN